MCFPSLTNQGTNFRVSVVRGKLMRSDWSIAAGVNNTPKSSKLKVNIRDQHHARENSCDHVNISFGFVCFLLNHTT